MRKLKNDEQKFYPFLLKITIFTLKYSSNIRYSNKKINIIKNKMMTFRSKMFIIILKLIINLIDLYLLLHLRIYGKLLPVHFIFILYLLICITFLPYKIFFF